MTAIAGKPRMLKTQTPGLTVGWRQGVYEKAGVGTLFLDILGELEYELSPVPRHYLRQLVSDPNAVQLMNSLMVMYGLGPS